RYLVRVRVQSGRISLFDVALRSRRQQPRPHLLLDLARDLLVRQQVRARVVLALADAAALVGVPSAWLFDDPERAAGIADLALARDALPVHDLELRLPERRRHLILHHLVASHVAGEFLAVLDRTDAPADGGRRGIDLRRVGAGGGFRVAEHHADLHAHLVDEDDDGVRAADVA